MRGRGEGGGPVIVGVYEHEERARQLIRFDGMNVEKRGFTDFDAVMEWRNLAWLVFEVKYDGKDVPIGQRIALERLVNDAARCGKLAVACVVDHDVSNPREDVYLRDCLVRSLYVSGEFRWRPPKRPMTARDLMRSFTNVVESSINRNQGRWS